MHRRVQRTSPRAAAGHDQGLPQDAAGAHKQQPCYCHVDLQHHEIDQVEAAHGLRLPPPE